MHVLVALSGAVNVMEGLGRVEDELVDPEANDGACNSRSASVALRS